MRFAYICSQLLAGFVSASLLWPVIFNARRDTTFEAGTLFADDAWTRLNFTILGIAGIICFVGALLSISRVKDE